MLRKKISNILTNLKEENTLRTLNVCPDNLLNLSSNDYLGLSNDKNLLKIFYNEYPELSLSSSSSRLISGTSEITYDLEKELQFIYKKPALLFNSGFDCNTCVIETFFNENTLIISDKLNHASIHDGIIHSKSNFLRYKHLDLDHLKILLEKNRNKYEDILVISETIYSMDGDCVNIDKLISLKKEFNFYLMIDEAHSYGVHGYGMIYEGSYINYVDFLTIPLGKGGGSLGSYLICDQLFKDYIINRGRKFIYTTSLPPINVAWNLFILKQIPHFHYRIEKLNSLTKLTHDLIKKYNLKTISNTHIISIIIGDNNKLNKIISYLKTRGFFVYGVKEPTVPKGTSRIRLGLNPTLTEQNIIMFFKELNYAINTLF